MTAQIIPFPRAPRPRGLGIPQTMLDEVGAKLSDRLEYLRHNPSEYPDYESEAWAAEAERRIDEYMRALVKHIDR